LYGSSTGAASLALGEAWESAQVSGHSGEMFRLNTGEYSYKYQWPLPRVISATREEREETTFAGVKGLTWWEDGDKPCRIMLHAVALNPVNPESPSEVKYQPDGGGNDKSICGGSPGNEKSVKFLDTTARYVRGVAVCTSEKKKSGDERLKGIRIYAAEIDANGRVNALDVDRDDAHVNCRQWHAPIYCPAGHIVSGLQVHHRQGYFTGLGIKCRQVVTAATPFKQ
jgi:hypothetical protein